MRYNFLLILFIVVTFYSCKKERSITDQPPGPPPGEPPIAEAFLKDITIPNVPSPYYHFEYNAAGKVNSVSFASGFAMYSVIYNGDRISEMQNNSIVNTDKLQYSYDNEGKVNMISYADFAGDIYVKVHLSYNGDKLVKLERERKSNNVFIFNKISTLSYYTDGNLKELVSRYPVAPNNPVEFTTTDKFEQYDDKINVDGFGLLHNEFFDHFVFLPGVRLQKNNPAKHVFTNGDVSYEVHYTYNYNNKNLPLSSSGDMVYLTGPQAGARFQLGSVYSYY